MTFLNQDNQQSTNPLPLQRSTINPYRHGLASILNRLKWDLNPESWRSRKKMSLCKDKYLNQKAVIVCNGPSLLDSDLSLLDNVFTFGLNKINLLFDKSSFRPSCIVAVNPLVIEQNQDFYNQTTIPLFLESYAVNFVKHSPNRIFFHSFRQDKFARDCSVSIYSGYTVTFVAMQLAFHMGFTSVALIGCDHNFSDSGPANMQIKSGSVDKNHFDPKYFSGGDSWQLPDLAGSEYNYTKAKDTFHAFDRTIFNATVGGKLTIFPRITLHEFIKSQ